MTDDLARRCPVCGHSLYGNHDQDGCCLPDCTCIRAIGYGTGWRRSAQRFYAARPAVRTEPEQ